jgi:MoaD family protein
MLMIINVKFVGALRHIAGKPEMLIDCSAGFSVKDLIQKIVLDIPAIKMHIIDQQTNSVVIVNVLVLVNDRELSVLNGVDTPLTDGDEVVFIPVAHGG